MTDDDARMIVRATLVELKPEKKARRPVQKASPKPEQRRQPVVSTLGIRLIQLQRLAHSRSQSNVFGSRSNCHLLKTTKQDGLRRHSISNQQTTNPARTTQLMSRKR